MFYRLLLALFFFTTLNAQNKLIIYSSDAHLFKISCSALPIKDSLVHEFEAEIADLDTLNLDFTIDDGTKLKKAVYLLEKGVPVKNKEFIYSLEFDLKTKKAELNFITSYTHKSLPWPLVPPKPVEDTTYKWRNNVYGNLFELKNGKVSFFFNLPKNGTCVIPMPEENVGYALKLIARTQINTEKYNYAREVLKSNCISCKQFSELMKGINFEIDKLKLFKEGYANITDKANVSSIEKEFKFESSKKEFKDVISNPANINAKNKISCSKAVHDSIPFALIKNLKLFTTDHEKFQYMKEKGSGLCFSTVQFKNILSAFIHDREKLDLTKQFYNNITDKENLSSLKEVFSYQETNANLMDFLKQQN